MKKIYIDILILALLTSGSVLADIDAANGVGDWGPDYRAEVKNPGGSEATDPKQQPIVVEQRNSDPIKNDQEAEREPELIDFQGQKQSLLDHISEAKLNPHYEFGRIQLITYTPEGIIQRGDVGQIREEDFQLIKEKNYVYIPFGFFREMECSVVEAGVIVTGTTDKEKADKIVKDVKEHQGKGGKKIRGC